MTIVSQWHNVMRHLQLQVNTGWLEHFLPLRWLGKPFAINLNSPYMWLALLKCLFFPVELRCLYRYTVCVCVYGAGISLSLSVPLYRACCLPLSSLLGNTHSGGVCGHVRHVTTDRVSPLTIRPTEPVCALAPVLAACPPASPWDPMHKNPPSYHIPVRNQSIISTPFSLISPCLLGLESPDPFRFSA